MRNILVLFLLLGSILSALSVLRTFTALTAICSGTSCPGMDTRTVVAGEVYYAKAHTLQLVLTGSPTTCTVALHGSLDGTNYIDLSGGAVSDCTVAGNRLFHITSKPIRHIRIVLSGLSGGSSPTVTPTYLGDAR